VLCDVVMSIAGDAGPYFVSNAIRESSYYTNDIEEADAIIVDDYCYKVSKQETHFYTPGHCITLLNYSCHTPPPQLRLLLILILSKSYPQPKSMNISPSLCRLIPILIPMPCPTKFVLMLDQIHANACSCGGWTKPHQAKPHIFGGRTEPNPC
jgi:hypothetical protein